MAEPDLDFLNYKAPSPPGEGALPLSPLSGAVVSSTPKLDTTMTTQQDAEMPVLSPLAVQPPMCGVLLPLQVNAEALAQLYNDVMDQSDALEAVFNQPPPDYHPTSIVQPDQDEEDSQLSTLILHRQASVRSIHSNASTQPSPPKPSANAVNIHVQSADNTPQASRVASIATLATNQGMQPGSRHESASSECSIIVHEEEETWDNLTFEPRVRKDSYKQPWIVPFEELQLGRVIGSGGFSTVSKGLWRGELVAVKQLLCGDRTPEKMEEMLTSEAELLNKLRHKHIIDFKAACVAPPHFCIVLELAAKGPLTKHIRDTLEPSLVVSWAQQLAKGMQYLHDEAPVTVIHRDLKPSNILVTAEDVLKITDFGLAKHHTHTTRMSAGGTYSYMAPESIQKSLFSKGSDVWSYGVVLWSILTAEVPYQGVEGLAVAYGVASNNLTLPIPDDCYQPFDGLLKACWQRNLKARPTFAAIINTLQGQATGAFLSVPRGTFKRMQSSWTPQIEALTQQLQAQEMALEGREEELMRLSEIQKAKEKELERREFLLQQREEELQSRQVKGQLEASPSMSTREERRGFLGRLVKRRNTSQSDLVSPPTNFRHISHVGVRDAKYQDFTVLRKRIESADASLADDPDSGLAAETNAIHRVPPPRRRGLLRPFKRGHSRSRSDATAEIRLQQLQEQAAAPSSPISPIEHTAAQVGPLEARDAWSSHSSSPTRNEADTTAATQPRPRRPVPIHEASQDGDRPRSFSM
eukprot:m.212445 g.212445  ORF g.212445 m.212445 type:complete len:752 (-) comp17162_c0_seq2:1736-3991(-)